VAFGDFGAKTQMMKTTMDTYQENPNPDIIISNIVIGLSPVSGLACWVSSTNSNRGACKD
jgi:hypothetical protein